MPGIVSSSEPTPYIMIVVATGASWFGKITTCMPFDSVARTTFVGAGDGALLGDGDAAIRMRAPAIRNGAVDLNGRPPRPIQFEIVSIITRRVPATCRSKP